MSIKLFLICVWSVGVFSVRAAVPVEGIIYFKEGKSVGFSGDHRVCIPKKAKMLKHSGAFSPGTNRKRFIRRRKSIQLSVGIPGHRNSGGNLYWQRVSVGVGSILLRRISRLTFTPDGAMVSLLTEESRFGNGEGSSVVRG